MGPARIWADRHRSGRDGDVPLGAVTASRVAADFADNLRFFTRLPIRGESGAPDFQRIGWATPLVGALVGAIGAAALLAARSVGFSHLMAATLAVAAEVVVTGALHEDGLADVADGFGGGRDRAAKLAILRDSRIGTYGAVALILALLLRIEAIGAMSRISL
ncbi:MAG: adenosylcobinamide-GDP ribazoletransferase, partial [Pseudomonadota bacterium]|nr:adenosylcobinamide-GDP ribazoletransferase [Pseudomonadota bacterium]